MAFLFDLILKSLLYRKKYKLFSFIVTLNLVLQTTLGFFKNKLFSMAMKIWKNGLVDRYLFTALRLATKSLNSLAEKEIWYH